MTQNQVVEWADKQVDLYNHYMENRVIDVGELELRHIDFIPGQLQFGGDESLFIAIAAILGQKVHTEVRTDSYIQLSFYYKEVKFFMLMSCPFEKEES